MFDIILKEQDLGKALHEAKKALDKISNAELRDTYEDIEADYQRMIDFMLRGYRDPNRAEVYQNLLRRTYRLMADIRMAQLTRENAMLADAQSRAIRANIHDDHIQQTLETYVQNTAMLSLVPDAERIPKTVALTKAHQQYIDALFCQILVSRQWTDGQRQRYEEMLTSPTIDSTDACLLVSAITLSLVITFDINKWLTLVTVSQRTEDVHVSQRALVGWAITLPPETNKIFPTLQETLVKTTQDERLRHQLLELQIQVFYANHAEKDNEEIQRDIIPNIIKNNPLQITPQGIVEREDDPLEDILSPGSAEDRMEEMEASVTRMMDMQRQGADIYFGGFSQMKRFPFFYKLSNWFCPFMPTHPDIAHAAQRLADTGFLQKLITHGPFCDSDKYSFVLALQSMIDKMPPDVKEMLAHAETLSPEATLQATHTTAYIRRMYLQDLYRFFRLYPRRQDFSNPFSEAAKGKGAFFFPLLRKTTTSMQRETVEMEKHLYKHSLHMPLARLLACNDHDTSLQHLVVAGYEHMHVQHYPQAQAQFQQAVTLYPDNEAAWRGLAQAQFYGRNYDGAESCYQHLCDRHTTDRHLRLCLDIARLHNGHTEQAMSDLFSLNYEWPDDSNILRALAWGYMQQGRYDHAEATYSKLLATHEQENKTITTTPSDYLNAAFCQWAQGRVSTAAHLLSQYRRLTGSDLHSEFVEEADLLSRLHIGQTERHLMLDIVNTPSSHTPDAQPKKEC